MKKKKDIYKKLFFVFTIFGVFLLIYSLFQPAIAMTPDNIVVPSGNKPVVTGFESCSARIRANDPINIDQFQDQVTHVAYIGYFGGTDGCYKQNMVNDRMPFIGFDVAIGKRGTPTEPLYIGVFKAEEQWAGDPFDLNNYHAYVKLEPSVNIDENLAWYSIDIINKPFDRKMVDIVCMSLADPDSNNCWMWGYSTGDPYNSDIEHDDPSISWDAANQWDWDASGWRSMDNIDFAFTTYTEGGSGGEQPIINITTNSWVTASQILGIFSLFGGIISGIKFRWY